MKIREVEDEKEWLKVSFRGLLVGDLKPWENLFFSGFGGFSCLLHSHSLSSHGRGRCLLCLSPVTSFLI